MIAPGAEREQEVDELGFVRASGASYDQFYRLRFSLTDIERTCSECGLKATVFEAIRSSRGILVHVHCAHCRERLATLPITQIVF